MESYGHTLWIDPKGKIIDITGKPLTHYDWLYNKLKPDEKSNIYALGAASGWIQVRNHVYMTSLGPSLSFTGTKKAMRKHRKVMFGIVDETLFSGKYDKFMVDITFLEDNGDIEGNTRHMFSMPRDDSKLRRFI